MAVKEPQNPADTLEAVAGNTNDYEELDREGKPSHKALPVWVLDPAEQSDIESEDISHRIVFKVRRYAVHLVSAKADGRAALNTLRTSYLDELFSHVEGTSEEGNYEFVTRRRQRSNDAGTNVIVDTLIIEATQHVRYNEN